VRREKKRVNYYPFGLKHKGYNDVVTSTNPAQDYKYQGQELNESFEYNMHEFQLRHYDATIGRFVTTDPYEQFMSPYLAMGNNPVTSYDPDGGFCTDANGNKIACPEGEEFDFYRDNDKDSISIEEEVVVTADLSDIKDKKENEAYWAEINSSAEILDKIETLNTGKTSEGRARELAMKEARIDNILIFPLAVESPQFVGSYPRAMDFMSGGLFMRTSSFTLKSLRTVNTVNTGRKYLNATEVATKMGGELIKKYKGLVDTGARSGEHGRAFIKAGQELIRKANKSNAYASEVSEAMKTVGNRLIKKGKGINHKM